MQTVKKKMSRKESKVKIEDNVLISTVKPAYPLSATNSDESIVEKIIEVINNNINQYGDKVILINAHMGKLKNLFGNNLHKNKIK